MTVLSAYYQFPTDTSADCGFIHLSHLPVPFGMTLKKA